MTPELLEFIKRKLQEGVSPNDIAASLSSRGWHDFHIEAAFNQLGYKTKAVGSGSASQVVALPSDSRVYPTINIPRIANPKRWWAIPLFGGLAKIVILIPVYFVIVFFGLLAGSYSLINSFIVLFKGRYWVPAYKQNLGLIRMLAKTYFFFMGLTDKYPGFSRDIKDFFTLDIAYPENPNRLYTIPIVGLLVRIVVLIPFLLYSNIIAYATAIGVYIFSGFIVLFRGKYPESTYELAVDSRRINFATQAYMAGLSDRYPSFRISMNHKDIKIALLLIGILLALAPAFSNPRNLTNENTDYQSPVGVEDQLPSNIQLAGEAHVDNQGGFKIIPPKGWQVDESGLSGPLVVFLNTETDQEGTNSFIGNSGE